MLAELVSLRVDGDRSADPRDYSGSRPVGQLLVGFVNGRVPGKVIGGRGFTFPVSEGVVLAEHPTREDLEIWSKVRWLVIDSRGVRAVADPRRKRRKISRLNRAIRRTIGRRR